MNFKVILVISLALVFAGVVFAEPYMPTEGEFAYVEVENYTLHDINFTVPCDFEITDSGDDFLSFAHGKDRLKISAVKDAKIKKVNSTKKVTSGKTMLGSQNGYLVDRNGSYTFSYTEGDYLVTIKSKNMPLIIGVMGKD